MLAFLEAGLTFVEVGGLIALRELATNFLEIPSGAAADVWGRRRALMVSFGAYVISFLAFGLASSPAMFIPAMLLFSVGEAFRTGTHKAMIFAWLKEQGRTDDTQITLFDSVGFAIEDFSALRYVRDQIQATVAKYARDHAFDI